MGTASAETWPRASSRQNPSVRLCLFGAGEGAGWARVRRSRLASSFAWDAGRCSAMLRCSSRTTGPGVGAARCSITKTLTEKKTWLCDWDGLPILGPETDTNPKAAVGSYLGFDANVNSCLSGMLWLWLTYLLLVVQGEPCSPLRYVALRLKTTFRVRTECGILFQMHICLGVFSKILLRILPASLDWQLAQKPCHLHM